MKDVYIRITELLATPECFVAWMQTQEPAIHWSHEADTCPIAQWLTQSVDATVNVSISMCAIGNWSIDMPLWGGLFIDFYDSLARGGGRGMTTTKQNIDDGFATQGTTLHRYLGVPA